MMKFSWIWESVDRIPPQHVIPYSVIGLYEENEYFLLIMKRNYEFSTTEGLINNKTHFMKNVLDTSAGASLAQEEFAQTK